MEILKLKNKMTALKNSIESLNKTQPNRVNHQLEDKSFEIT